MSQLVKGLSHVLYNCYKNNSLEKTVSASQALGILWNQMCFCTYTFHQNVSIIEIIFKNYLLVFLRWGVRTLLLYMYLMIIPMVRRASTKAAAGQCGQGMGSVLFCWDSTNREPGAIRSILETQSPRATWNSVDNHPCGNINKGYLIKYFILLTKGFSECLHLTCKLGQVAD